ncbi:unnamed protein product [Amoebophrya sp. A25]|nr:unnamed protein product [Amoebophrya sp. A25]|eukprot:GSA25T00025653001.1
MNTSKNRAQASSHSENKMSRNTHRLDEDDVNDAVEQHLSLSMERMGPPAPAAAAPLTSSRLQEGRHEMPPSRMGMLNAMKQKAAEMNAEQDAAKAAAAGEAPPTDSAAPKASTSASPAAPAATETPAPTTVTSVVPEKAAAATTPAAKGGLGALGGGAMLAKNGHGGGAMLDKRLEMFEGSGAAKPKASDEKLAKIERTKAKRSGLPLPTGGDANKVSPEEGGTTAGNEDVAAATAPAAVTVPKAANNPLLGGLGAKKASPFGGALGAAASKPDETSTTSAPGTASTTGEDSTATATAKNPLLGGGLGGAKAGGANAKLGGLFPGAGGAAGAGAKKVSIAGIGAPGTDGTSPAASPVGGAKAAGGAAALLGGGAPGASPGATPKAGLGGLFGGGAKKGGGGLNMTGVMLAKKQAAKIKEKAKRLREEKHAHLKNLPPLQTNVIEKKKRLQDPDVRSTMTPMQRLVTHKHFDVGIGICIMLNVLFMGIEYQVSDRDIENKALQMCILISDLIFLMVFTAELCLRIKAFGIKEVVFNFMYLLDVVVVSTGLISEVILPIAAGTFLQISLKDSDPMLNLVRSTRALRALRVLRVLTMFEALWHVVELFFFSLTPLFWAVGFILVVVFMFAIFTIVLIGRADLGSDPGVLESQESFYSTSKALITLFQIMTLDGWTGPTQPLFEQEVWTYFWFLFFISISAFSLMNLITVTVLETAREQQVKVQTNTDIDHKTQEISDLLDFPGDEEVTTKEYFINNWMKNRALRHLFDKLHLNAQDAGGFFDALDIDGSGGLDHFELATTYMELVSSVMDSSHNIALIRSACDPEEKTKLLKSTMLQSQQGRFAAEVRQAREEEKTAMEAERAKAQKDRDAMRTEMTAMQNEMARLAGVLTEVKGAMDERIPQVDLSRLVGGPRGLDGMVSEGEFSRSVKPPKYITREDGTILKRKKKKKKLVGSPGAAGKKGSKKGGEGDEETDGGITSDKGDMLSPRPGDKKID